MRLIGHVRPTAQGAALRGDQAMTEVTAAVRFWWHSRGVSYRLCK